MKTNFLKTKNLKTKIMKTNYLKIAFVAITMLSVGTMKAQVTDASVAAVQKKASAIKLIDNKGTIKYLQSINGITQITSTSAGNLTTTTWQLGGTLDAATYIDVNGKAFSLDGLKLVDPTTAPASTDAADLSSHGGTTSGWTVLVRDETSGEFKKIKASDLLKVQSGQVIIASPVIGANTITGLPATVANVSVYRNGAKLTATVDYTTAADTMTLIDMSAATAPADWTLYTGDVVEVHWVK